MRFLNVCASLVGLALMVIVSAGSANAQASRTWVSGVGDDANPCSRTAPCKTFAGSISKTAPGGEINCLDPAGYGAVTITKAITINCEETLGSVLVSGTSGIIVSAGVNDVITLKGLEFEGLNSGISAIRFLAGKELHVHKFQIRNFLQNGIDVEPSTNGAKIFIADGYISHCGGTSAGVAGILFKPASGVSVNATVQRVQIEANATGILMDGSLGAAVSNFAINESVVSGGTVNGISVSKSTAGIFTVMISNSLIASNVGSGVGVVGANATARIGNNMIVHNVTGASSSGTLQSFKNNMFEGNGSDGTPITAVPGNSGTLQ